MKPFQFSGVSALTVFAITFILVTQLSAAWFDPDWACRRPIMLDNSLNTDTLLDFQVRMDIPYDTDMQPDFDDIRFTGSDSVTSLPYWIAECYQANRAVVYVKVPLIPGGDSTCIFMYYGNPSATSESNGYAVFEFFDDFADGDISDWSIFGGTWTGNNRFLEQLETANHRRILGPFRNLNASITEATMAYLSTYEYAGNHIFFSTDSSAYTGYYFGFDGLTAGGEGTCIARINGGANILVSDPAINSIDYNFVRLRAKIIYDGAGNYAFHLKAPDSVQVYIAVNDQVYSGPYVIGAWVGSHICIDDIRIRKFARNEPEYEIGEEQSPASVKESPHTRLVKRPSLSVLSSNPGYHIHLLLEIPARMYVNGTIYDFSGRRCCSFIPGRNLMTGNHRVTIETDGWATGIYFISIILYDVHEAHRIKHHLKKKVLLFQ